MDPREAYKFCPRCSGKLESKEESMQCVECGFHLYINPAACNAVIIENDKKEIILVKRKFEPHKGSWDLPGGFIIPNEDFETSVKREIKEELNVEVELIDIIGLFPDTYVYQGLILPTISGIATAKFVSGTYQASDDAEEFEFVPKSEVLSRDMAFPATKRGLEKYISETFD